MKSKKATSKSKNNRLHIDMLALFQTGEFGNVRLGQSKEQILANFVKPEMIEIMDNDTEIWWYGNIEFHMIKNELTTIYSDHFLYKKLHGGTAIRLKPWIFKHKKIRLSTLLSSLNTQHIDYQKKTTKLNIQLHLTNNILLYIENLHDKDNLDPNDYLLSAFAVTNRSFI